MQVAPQLTQKILVVAALILVALSLGRTEVARAQESELATPTLTISAPSKSFKADTRPFAITLEAIRHVTPDSQYFFRTSAGLNALKALGVTSILYTVDRNNWRDLYDDMSGEPQPFPAGITPTEVVSIAKAIGAELVPILNVTVQCKRANVNQPYSSENMTCEHAKVGDSVDLVKFLKTETHAQGVTFKRVVLGLEPYAGCAYWTQPAGVNCVLDNPPGQHRIGLPAEEYAKRINEWATKIHKEDKSILIGAQLSPNVHFCKTSCDREWTQVILQDAGKNIDFVLLHQYFRIPDPGATDLTSALEYSYFQNQIDINVRKRGATGMPSKMRKDIVKWAPTGKKQMPMWYAEMNASIVDTLDGEDAAQVRRTLYAGLAIGELYLEMMKPLKVSGELNPAATRVFLHHLFTTRTFIGAYQPPNELTQTMIFAPSWHILATLKPFAGQTWQTVKAKDVPTNSSGRAIITGYAARSGKNVTLAFFNHDNQQTYTIDAKLTDMIPKSATLTRVGDTAVSLFTQNNAANPNAMVPQTSTFPASQIKKWGLDELTLPPHSLTLVKITLK